VVETIEDLLRAWPAAEARGDVAALDPLLDADFRGDGLLGFVLDKAGWLDRYRRGELTTDAFVWQPAGVWRLNQTAVAAGSLVQTARYCGQDVSGSYRCTLVAVRRDGRWTIVNLQLSRPRP
jgi:hypothetical protein